MDAGRRSISAFLKEQKSILTPRILILALAFLVFSLLVTSWGWRRAVRFEAAHARQLLQERARNLGGSLLERLRSREATLRAAAWLAAAPDKAGRGTWDLYMERLRLSPEAPGSRGMEIGFLGASAGEPSAAPGMPLEAAWVPAMDQARDSGVAVISGPMAPGRNPEGPGREILMFCPVYARGVPLPSAQARRLALRGFVTGRIRLADLFAGLVDPAPTGGEVLLDDGASMGADARLFHSPAPAPGPRATLAFDAFGRPWVLQITAPGTFRPGAEGSLSNLILASGVIRSLALFILAFALLLARNLALSRRQALAKLQEANLRVVESHADVVRAKALLQNIVDNLPLAVVVKDPLHDFRTLLWNKGAEALFGVPAAETVGRGAHAFLPGERADLALASDRHAMKEGRIVEETEELHGTYLHTRRLALTDPEGGPGYLLTLSEDVTRHKLEQERLALAAKVFANCSEGICITDAGNRILSVNPAFTRMTGYPVEELLGQDPRVLSSHRQDQAFYEHVWDALLTQGRWQGQIWDRRKDGEVYPKWMTIDTVKDASGEIVNFVAISSDISLRIAAEENLRFIAEHDPLTSLPNRVLLADRFTQAAARANREGRRVGLLFLDLDHFKQVNDTLGHVAGDGLLQQVAARLSSVVRASDTVTRIGGDEFIIMLPDLEHEAQITGIAGKILESVSGPYALAGKETAMTFSIGGSCHPDHGTTLDRLVRCADLAMYAAKAGGRNQYHYYSASMEG